MEKQYMSLVSASLARQNNLTLCPFYKYSQLVLGGRQGDKMDTQQEFHEIDCLACQRIVIKQGLPQKTPPPKKKYMSRFC